MTDSIVLSVLVAFQSVALVVVVGMLLKERHTLLARTTRDLTAVERARQPKVVAPPRLPSWEEEAERDLAAMGFEPPERAFQGDAEVLGLDGI